MGILAIKKIVQSYSKVKEFQWMGSSGWHSHRSNISARPREARGVPCPTEKSFPGRRQGLGETLDPVASVPVVPGTVHNSVCTPQ